jgi:hypothetical protein
MAGSEANIVSAASRNVPADTRQPWQSPRVKPLDAALDTKATLFVGSDAGYGSTHS